MILYTINGKYPDKELGFNLVGEDFGVASANHIHDGTQFDYASLLAPKANLSHTHTEYLKELVVNADILTGVVEIAGAGNTSVTGDTILETGQSRVTIDLSFTTQESIELSDGFTNINPARRHTMTSISTNVMTTVDNSQTILFIAEANN